MSLIIASKLEGGILHLTLNRPEQLNALSLTLLEQLQSFIHQAREDASVRALMITGAGKGFCAGADIKELSSLNEQTGREYAERGQRVFNQLELLGKPSVALVQGFAFGGGCELAMACTVRIATPQTLFAQPEIKLGVIPGFGGTQRLPRLIGKGRAMALCLTGQTIDGNKAFEWGLVNELASIEALSNKGMTFLKTCLSFSGMTIEKLMHSIHQGTECSLERGLQLEAAQFGLCCGTVDKQEGVSAFIEKRTPCFKGK